MTVAKAQAGVKNNLRRLNRSIVRNGSNHIVHVVLFALICFTIVYLWSKMSRKWGFPGIYFSQHCCWTQVFLWMTHNDAWVCCIEKLCNFLCVTGGFCVKKKDNMVFCSLQSRAYVTFSSGEILIIHKNEQDSIEYTSIRKRIALGWYRIGNIGQSQRHNPCEREREKSHWWHCGWSMSQILCHLSDTKKGGGW